MFTAIYQALILPLKSIRLRYVPLLLIYFAYGASGFAGIAETFWVKKELNLSAVDLLALGVWMTVPWTIKMIFGQMVDSITLFGSNRKIYVYIGASLITLSIFLLMGVASNAPWMAEYSKESVFILSSVIGVVGYVLQDVVADTMSTEVIDKNQSQEEINRELATIQVLGRLSLGMAGVAVAGVGGWLAQNYSFAEMLTFSLFIPLLSILGVTLVRLNPVGSTPLNKQIFFGGWFFALFVVLIGYNNVAYSQEIVFFVSLAVVIYMLRQVIQDLPADTIKHIYMAMVIIFVYRAMPSVGPSIGWWQIDILGFDEAFFGTLRQIGAVLALIGLWVSTKYIINRSIGKVLIFLTLIGFILSLPTVGLYYGVHEMLGVDARTVALLDTAVASPFDYIAGVLMLTLVAIYAPEGKKGTWFALMASLMNIALSAGGLFSKYLNKLFVVTREVKENGVVVVAQDYSQLGFLLWVVVLIALIVPIVTILLFDPKEKSQGGRDG
jgi:MFS family permease